MILMTHIHESVQLAGIQVSFVAQVLELDQERIYRDIQYNYRKPWGLNRFYLVATEATAMVFL